MYSNELLATGKDKSKIVTAVGPRITFTCNKCLTNGKVRM
jgi:hypothetical protein